MQKQVDALRRDIRQLHLERSLLKKANELLKKGLGVDLPLLTNREKTILVDALKQTYAISKLSIELDLARTSAMSWMIGSLAKISLDRKKHLIL